MRMWIQQTVRFAAREVWRAVRNTWLLVFVVLVLFGSILILRFATPGSAGFLFLQVQLFLLPLFAVLMGCSSAHEDLEELPVLFSQPVYRGAFLLGKWIAFTGMLGAIMALAMGISLCMEPIKTALILLWLHSIALAGVFVAMGLVLGIAWNDRARGIIASLFAWLLLVFGCDALAWIAVQTELAIKWPVAWVMILFTNPPSVFRIGALLALEDVPFLAPTAQPFVTWLLQHTLYLTPLVCVIWIALTLRLGAYRLRFGLEPVSFFKRKRQTVTK